MRVYQPRIPLRYFQIDPAASRHAYERSLRQLDNKAKKTLRKERNNPLAKQPIEREVTKNHSGFLRGECQTTFCFKAGD